MCLSAFIALSLAGLVILNRYNRGDRPAAIQVRALEDRIRQNNGSYYLPIEVKNTGSKSAEVVKIEGSVGEETREFEVDFLDGAEKAEGTLVFTRDPRNQVKLEVISFIEPS